MTLPEQLSIDLLVALNPVLEQLRVRREKLADQLERAATSVALNLAECRGRTSRDRIRAMRIAAAEAAEVKAALSVARALGHVGAAEHTAAFAIADRLNGVLFGLLRKLA
jgi:four helix bundle protein